MDINVANMLRVGTVLHGTYSIDRYLSSGGFGNTYVATNIQFGEQYAIKEFFMRGVSQRDDNNTTVSVSNSDNRETFSSQLEKFKKEARRLRKLNNEHIVRVHDLFEENGTAYYVMDYIDGENLSDRLKRTGKPLSEAKVMQLLPQILDALETAHKEGILHLDLKPANIMVDKQGVVKLIDFGASKQQSAQGGATTSTAVSYTNGYAPREQMEQNLEKFGPWTDFYALGATLYNLITNKKPPLPSDIDDDGSEDKHLALPMPANYNEKLRKLVLWLLETDKRRRPQSIDNIRNFISCSNTTYVVPNEDYKREGIEDEGKTYLIDSKAYKKTGYLPEDKRKKQFLKFRLNRNIVIGSFVFVVAIICYCFISNRDGKNNNARSLDSTRRIESPSKKPELTAKDTAIIQWHLMILEKNMVYVKGGTYYMGKKKPDQGLGNDGCYKCPVHKVTLSSFYICKYEVTQLLWWMVMRNNPSHIKGDQLPVDNVKWKDCQEFIKRVNLLTGRKFRLPTEAEWEFSARGGIHSRGYKYAGGNWNIFDELAWNKANSGNRMHPVGQKKPNELGLYDMSGNVWEWCQDYIGSYSVTPQTNPHGPKSGEGHIIRGGAYWCDAEGCNVSWRAYHDNTTDPSGVGLRLAE